MARWYSLLAIAVPLSAAPVRLLILSGHNNHEWRQTTPHIRRILETTGRFEVRVNETPAALTPDVLQQFDAVLSDYCGPRWSTQAEGAIEEFVRSGKGLIVVHAASYPFGIREVLGERMTSTGRREPPWPAWGDMVGAVWTETPRTGHGKRHIFEVKWRDRSHPVAAGLPPSFTISDELYQNFQMKPGVHVLASAFSDPATGGTGKDEPLLWTVSYGRGRVFHTALGHDLIAQAEAGYQLSLARGAEWAATGAVSIPAQWTLDPKNSDAVQVLLVTGGHSHEASFYGIFEHMRDVRVNVNPHPIAFRGDLRKHYDVLVLYDMVQDLPEDQRRNLQAFAEAGKGIVALHHSIANFQTWQWWWKELIGGRYVLKAEPGYPASAFLHDVDLKVNVVAQHAVTRGLPAAKVFDETYKHLWRAPGIQVLLETEHPTSDRPLAWISPYPKSRVVYIQLGHGREAHENAWYRQLVRNAILWAGGRSETGRTSSQPSARRGP